MQQIRHNIARSTKKPPLNRPQIIFVSPFGREKDKKVRYYLPMYGSRVVAGFPSPADDFLDGKISLDEQLVQNPSSTFFVRVSGDSMTGAGIFPGDVLVVDRSIEPKNNTVVLAVVNGEFTVKRLRKTPGGKIRLCPENPKYRIMEFEEGDEVSIWGSVTATIHDPNQ